MTSAIGTRLSEHLHEANVLLKLERRGRDPLPGRPDSVIWLRPDGVPVPWTFPILIELEGKGNYHAAKQDIVEFAARHRPDKRPDRDQFQYHLNFPTTDLHWLADYDPPGRSGYYIDFPAPETVDIKYGILAVPSETVTGEVNTRDAMLHRALRDEFRDAVETQTTPQGFETSVRVISAGQTELVYWEVKWSVFGRSGEVSVPFVTRLGSGVDVLLKRVLSKLRVPVLAVIDGSPGTRSSSMVQATGARFPLLSPYSI